MGLAALASVAVPLALAWAALGIWLGRAQRRMAVDGETVRSSAMPPTSK
jgi:AAA family ATP:ADP antiporter